MDTTLNTYIISVVSIYAKGNTGSQILWLPCSISFEWKKLLNGEKSNSFILKRWHCCYSSTANFQHSANFQRLRFRVNFKGIKVLYHFNWNLVERIFSLCKNFAFVSSLYRVLHGWIMMLHVRFTLRSGNTIGWTFSPLCHMIPRIFRFLFFTLIEFAEDQIAKSVDFTNRSFNEMSFRV